MTVDTTSVAPPGVRPTTEKSKLYVTTLVVKSPIGKGDVYRRVNEQAPSSRAVIEVTLATRGRRWSWVTIHTTIKRGFTFHRGNIWVFTFHTERDHFKVHVTL